MSKLVHKQHSVSCLLYHFVCPAKYRRKVFTETVEQSLKNVCGEIEHRYDMTFVEIGADEDHVHFRRRPFLIFILPYSNCYKTTTAVA